MEKDTYANDLATLEEHLSGVRKPMEDIVKVRKQVG